MRVAESNRSLADFLRLNARSPHRNSCLQPRQSLIAIRVQRDPILRYWVSFAGVHTDVAGTGLEASPDSKLQVLARKVPFLAVKAISETGPAAYFKLKA